MIKEISFSKKAVERINQLVSKKPSGTFFRIAEKNIKDIEHDENNFKRYEFLLKLFDKAEIINQINLEKS